MYVSIIIINYVILITDRLYCPELQFPNSNVAEFNKSGLVVGSIITVACKAGYLFEDGTASRTLMCKHDRTWSSDIHCKGEYFDIHYHSN